MSNFNSPAIRRVTNNFNAKNLCDSRIYEYSLPTYIFHSTLFSSDNVNQDTWKTFPDGLDSSALKAVTEEMERYRVTPDQLECLKNCLKGYVGTFNFHNFTEACEFKPSSNKRFIKSFEVTILAYITLPFFFYIC